MAAEIFRHPVRANVQLHLDFVLTRITRDRRGLHHRRLRHSRMGDRPDRAATVRGRHQPLIVVNVTVDTATQIQSHLLAHQYG